MSIVVIDFANHRCLRFEHFIGGGALGGFPVVSDMPYPICLSGLAYPFQGIPQIDPEYP